MTYMHYYQFNIGDYSSHTKHLTPLEDICYRRLLDWYYLHEKPIPKDINVVTRMLILNGCSTEVEQVLNEFFVATKTGWINPRADKEIDSYHNKVLSSSRAGKISAEKRKTYNQQPLNDPSTDVKPNINHKPLTNNHKPTKYIPPIPTELLSALMVIRKAKRLGAVTEIAFNGMRKQAESAGLSVEQALTIAVERGWGSFNASWEWKDKPNKQNKRDQDLNWFLGNQPAIEKDITHG